MSRIEDIRAAAPDFCAEIDDLVRVWLEPIAAALEHGTVRPSRKTMHDPVWETVDLDPCEVLLIDTPMLQRLRGIKQLGLAHLVFTGATNDRFAHSCGIVEAVERMMRAIERNSQRRTNTTTLPTILPEERRIVRLAALLHDIGHGPFSHAIESIIEIRYQAELDKTREALKTHFLLDKSPQAAEIIAVLMIGSQAFQSLLFNSIFGFQPGEYVPEKLIACILGARLLPTDPAYIRPFLTALVSSVIDGDKLDYLARDAHHSGLPIRFDSGRLIARLEILKCRRDSLPQGQEVNSSYADDHPDGEYYDLGLSDGGVGAFEQMLVNRTFLYDRLYHHHKVRAADAMAQRLVHFAGLDKAEPFSIKELYLNVPDETMIRLLGGMLTHPNLNLPSSQEASQLATALVNRELYVRAFAFRSSLFAGINEADKDEADSVRREIWATIRREIGSMQGRLDLEEAIYEKACAIGSKINDKVAKSQATQLRRSHVIADIAPSRHAPPSINTLTSDGSIEPPVLSFDQHKWAEVYARQKQTGFIFAPREVATLVSLASHIVFLERYDTAVGQKAARVARAAGLIPGNWWTEAVHAGLLSELDRDRLLDRTQRRRHVAASNLLIPPQWQTAKPELAQLSAERLRMLRPDGFSKAEADALEKALSTLFRCMQLCYDQGTFKSRQNLSERDFQKELRARLGMLIEVEEGGSVGGGERDLKLAKEIILENKVLPPETDPWSGAPDAGYQARRYAMSQGTSVVVTLVAYKPATEADLIQPYDSIKIELLEQSREGMVQIRLAIPYGHGNPSRARGNRKKAKRSTVPM